VLFFRYVKKSPVFALLWYAWGGDDTDGGVPKEVYLDLYQGKWPEWRPPGDQDAPAVGVMMPRKIPVGTHLANVLYLVIQGAGGFV